MKSSLTVLTLAASAALAFGCDSTPPELPGGDSNKAKEGGTASSADAKASPGAEAAKQKANRDAAIRKAIAARRAEATPKAANPASASSKVGPDKPIEAAKGAPAPALLKPDAAKAKAPATFKTVFDTTKGSFTIETTRAWSPNGADRFYNLVKIGFYDGVAFFRIKKDFMAQFGIHGDPKVTEAWSKSQFQDDPKTEQTQSNTRGMVTFAKTGLPNSRTTQLFVNYSNNARLDGMGFTPFGKITDGMKVLDDLFDGYGLALGSKQGAITMKGNAFLAEKYPKVDYIKTARIK